MVLMNILQALIPIFISISESSPMLVNNGLSILLCKSKCKVYAGCKSVRFDTGHLRCELLFGAPSTDLEEKGLQIFKVQHAKSTVECDKRGRIICNRRGTLKCVKAAMFIKTGPKKKSKVKKPPGKLTAEQKLSCILYRQENITCKSKFETINLPLTLKPGMKMTITGGCISTDDTLDVSFTKAQDANAKNVMNWFHINIRLSQKRLVFVTGFQHKDYKGDFPIKDPSYFSLGLELTQSVTQINVDDVQVNSIDVVTGLKDFAVVKYKKIYGLVVQKTGDGCD